MLEAHLCTNCKTSVGPEQHRCPVCKARLGFVPELGLLCAFEDRREAGWHPLGVRGVGVRLPCGNYGEHPICHWTVPADASDCYCEACRCMARTPSLSEPVQRQRWTRFGRARRRLFVGLRQLGLLDSRGRVFGLPEPLFDVVDSDLPAPEGPAVRAGGSGSILVDLRRIDAMADRDLFEAVRRAVGLRLGLARGIGLGGLANGGPVDPDRLVAEWESSWATVDTGGRERPEIGHHAARPGRGPGGAGLLA